MHWTSSLAAILLLGSLQETDEVRVSAHAYVPPQLRLSLQVQLVQMGVVVRDGHGRAVSGLQKSDFQILDEGKPREIAAFSEETHPAQATPAAGAAVPKAGLAPLAVTPPRSTLLYFDDLHGTAAEFQRAQIAGKRFVKSGLGPGGKAAVYAASEGVTLDFTADPAALAAAIEKLHSHTRISESGMQPCPRMPPYQAYLIANNLDQIALQSAVIQYASCAGLQPTPGLPGPSIPMPTGSMPLPTTISPSAAKGVASRGAASNGVSSISTLDPIVTGVRTIAQVTWDQVQGITESSFDSISAALARLASAPGSRTLLMISTGFLSGMMDVERAAVIDRAIHYSIVINALDAKGVWSEPPGHPFGENEQTAWLPPTVFMFETESASTRADALNVALREFASGTGGLFFHNSNDLAGGFAQLAALPETTYLLAFRPDPDELAGKYHRLKVRLTPGHSGYVQARPGYFAPAQATVTVRRMDREVTASDTIAEIPVDIAGILSETENGIPVLRLIVHVDVSRLQFTEREGRHVEKLDFIGAMVDNRGNLLTAKEGSMDLALTDETLHRLSPIGLNATLTLRTRPGPYWVRLVAEESGGKMAALSRKIDIPF